MTDTATTTGELLQVALGATEEPEPQERLNAIRALRQHLDAAENDTAQACRAGGASWTDIGQQWGISRQAAHQRFAVPPVVDYLAAPDDIEANNERGHEFMAFWNSDEGEAEVEAMNRRDALATDTEPSTR